MAHIPYGYKVNKGIATIDTAKAKQVKALFTGYISGLSLQTAAERLGIPKNHVSIGKMLEDKKYLGDGFYPAIIDEDAFYKVQAERQRRAAALGRNKNFFAKDKDNISPFWGKVYCAECGSEFKRYSIKGKDRWRCSRYLVNNKVCCKSAMVAEHCLEDAFTRVIKKVATNKEGLKLSTKLNEPIISEEAQRIDELIANTFSKDEKLKLIFKRAEAIYKEAKVDDFDFQTDKLKAALENTPETFEGDFLKSIVKRIVVSVDNVDNIAVFELINGHEYIEELI